MKINMKIKLSILFTTISVMHYFGQQQNNYTLQQAIDFAVKNSPSQLNSELDLQSTVYKRNEVLGLGLPQINGSFDFKDYLELPTSIIPLSAFSPLAPPNTYAAVKFGTQYNATGGVSANQLLFSADYLFGLKASKELINLSRVNVNRSKTDLVAQVSKAYYGVLVNKERLKLIDANIEKLEKNYSEVSALNKQGFVELIDVERLEVAKNNLAVEKQKVSEMLKIGENMLKFQMGYKLNEPILLVDSLVAVDGLDKELSTNNIDISNKNEYLILNAQQKLYDIDVKRLKWGYLPTIAAYGSYQYQTMRKEPNIFDNDKNNAIKQWYPIGVIGVQMNINIFDGLQRHFKIQQSKITSQKNQNNLKNIELAAQFEASTAAISYNNALKTLSNNKRNMELAQNVFNVSTKKYQQGIGSNIEVINAQTSMREAEVNYYNALYDVLIYKIDYQKATGTLVK